MNDPRKEIELKVKNCSVQDLKNFLIVGWAFKLIAWAVGLGCMAVAWIAPFSLFVIIPCALLVFIAADADCNIDFLIKLVRQELQTR